MCLDVFFIACHSEDRLNEESQILMTKLDKVPSTVESTRDLLAGCLSVVSQSVGISVSCVNTFLSLFKQKRVDSYVNILITGASSGIGKALAIKFAQTGQRRLVLLGRNQGKLDTTAQECTALGSHVVTMVSDFSNSEDLDAFASFVAQQDIQHPFDLVVANAGMLAFNAEPSVSANGTSTAPAGPPGMIDTNIKGMLATFMPILDFMKTRDNGHIVLLSSINAYLGASNQYLYSATKSFARTLGQDLGQQLRNEGSKVRVTVVAPGLVDTGMTAAMWESPRAEDRSSAPRSLAQDPGKFAVKVYKGIVRGDRFITYPYYQFYQSYLGGTLPPTVRDIASCIVSSTGIAGKRVT